MHFVYLGQWSPKNFVMTLHVLQWHVTLQVSCMMKQYILCMYNNLFFILIIWSCCILFFVYYPLPKKAEELQERNKLINFLSLRQTLLTLPGLISHALLLLELQIWWPSCWWIECVNRITAGWDNSGTLCRYGCHRIKSLGVLVSDGFSLQILIKPSLLTSWIQFAL